MIPTLLMVRSTEWEGHPTWTVAARMPNGAIALASFTACACLACQQASDQQEASK